jgi:hypothetical protein
LSFGRAPGLPWRDVMGDEREQAKAKEAGEVDRKLPENTKENLDDKLDEGIEESFPASDPVSVKITK